MCKKASHFLYLLSIHRRSLTYDILKMLVESLILSRFDYALPVWGPPLQVSQVSQLQNLQNRAIRVTRSLHKYDHISMHRNALKWLPISCQIKLRSVAAMSHYYRQKGCLLLYPPILYGQQHSYRTRCREYFASVDLCQLANTKRHFCFAATTWWNSLPSSLHDCSNINFMKEVKVFYLDDCFD